MLSIGEDMREKIKQEKTELTTGTEACKRKWQNMDRGLNKENIVNFY